jgi:hypothetical protein
MIADLISVRNMVYMVVSSLKYCRKKSSSSFIIISISHITNILVAALNTSPKKYDLM